MDIHVDIVNTKWREKKPRDSQRRCDTMLDSLLQKIRTKTRWQEDRNRVMNGAETSTCLLWNKCPQTILGETEWFHHVRLHLTQPYTAPEDSKNMMAVITNASTSRQLIAHERENVYMTATNRGKWWCILDLRFTPWSQKGRRQKRNEITTQRHIVTGDVSWERTWHSTLCELMKVKT